MNPYQEKFQAAARQAIEQDANVIYDVAANSGQMVGNVKHMNWFVDAVADWLQEDAQIDRDFAQDTLDFPGK